MRPIASTHKHWYQARMAVVVTLHGARKLDTVAVLGCKKICAHEHNDDFAAIQFGIDYIVPLFAGSDLMIVPGSNQAISLQHCEMIA